jgi:hypothetical protein
MNKKFDAITAKKLINEYADKINFLMKENTSLKSQLNDIKITLNINKDLMFKSVNGESVESVLNHLKEENMRLTELIDTLNKEKADMEIKVYTIII